MLNFILKIVLSLAALSWSVYQFMEGEIANGIFFVLLASIVVLLIFRNETLLRAFWFIRKGDMVKAYKILSSIKDTRYWVKSQQAYYNYLLALSMSQDRGIFEAEKYFKKSLNLGLRMKHDQAMAKLSLATAAMSRRRKKEAAMLLNEAKKLDKNNMLADQIKMLKEQMKRI